MALFIDGTISTLADLTGHESSLLDVAATEGIDVARKQDLAAEELGVELGILLARLSGYWSQCAATLGPSLEAVVVTPPLRMWHTYRTLEMVFRDASNSQLNERYKAKRDLYRDLAKWAQEKLAQAGVGLVWEPIPQAGEPVLKAGPGSLVGGTYYVTTAWVSRGGDEGACGVAKTIEAATGSGFVVEPAAAPATAVGWHVYAGTAQDNMVRQNPAVLEVVQTWAQNTMPTEVGAQPGSGQAPNYLRPLPQLLQRG